MIYSEECNFWHMQMLVFIDVFICHLAVSEVVQQLAVQNSLHGQFLKTVKIVQSRMSRTWMHVVFPHESTWHPFSLVSCLIFYLVIPSCPFPHPSPSLSSPAHLLSGAVLCVSRQSGCIVYVDDSVRIRSSIPGTGVDGWMATVVSG